MLALEVAPELAGREEYGRGKNLDAAAPRLERYAQDIGIDYVTLRACAIVK